MKISTTELLLWLLTSFILHHAQGKKIKPVSFNSRIIAYLEDGFCSILLFVYDKATKRNDTKGDNAVGVLVSCLHNFVHVINAFFCFHVNEFNYYLMIHGIKMWKLLLSRISFFFFIVEWGFDKLILF